MTRNLTLAVLALVLGYGGFKAWALVSGPHIELKTTLQAAIPAQISSTTPSEGSATVIYGKTTNTETLTLNGSTLLIDEHGNFEKTMTLPRGGVILSLTATDRFGKSRSVTRTLILP